MTTFVGQTVNEPTMPPAYLLPMRPRDIPAGYICYRNGAVLTNVARSFLVITRRYFQRTTGWKTRRSPIIHNPPPSAYNSSD